MNIYLLWGGGGIGGHRGALVDLEGGEVVAPSPRGILGG
jgi:hypothetical protein